MHAVPIVTPDPGPGQTARLPRLAGYQRATILSFAALEAAALLGLLVALLSGKTSYGLVLCGAALLGMVSRWPREVEVDRLMRGKASP